MANFTLDQTGQEIQDILDTVGNNQATSGQVLTADGSGGASWQNASGGKKLYNHNITFSSASEQRYIRFSAITDTSETIDTIAKICSLLNSQGGRICVGNDFINGYVYSYLAYYDGTSFRVWHYKIGDTTQTDYDRTLISSYSGGGISDIVTEL